MFAILRLCVATLASLLPLAGQSETTNCTAIPSVPFTISAAGVYCLNTDLITGITSGAAVTINANSVTIDMNGRRLAGGQAGTATTAVGIYANNRRNITMRNGTIRGFWKGIFLDNGGSHLIEQIRADANTQWGIQIYGHNSVVRNNQVSNTGGTTAASVADTYGIFVQGDSNHILDNDVMHSFANGKFSRAVGILAHGANAVVESNRISNLISALANTNGIWCEAASNTLIAANRISGSSAADNAIGIRVTNLSANVVVRDNLITGVATTGVYFEEFTSGVRSGNVVQGATTPYVGAAEHATTNYP